MRWKSIQMAVILAFAAVAGAAQQSPNPNPNPDKNGNQSQNPTPKGKQSGSKKPEAQQHAPMVDSDEPSAPASAEEDIDVAAYYIRKGDPDAAIPRLQEAIQEKPKLAKPRLMLAEVYEKKGDARSAIRYYKEYLQAFPTAPDAGKIEKKIDKLTQKASERIAAQD